MSIFHFLRYKIYKYSINVLLSNIFLSAASAAVMRTRIHLAHIDIAKS